MPHTTVEYSASVAGAFDRPAFGKDLHEALVRIAGGRTEGCKTRFLPLHDTYLGDGSAHHAMVHAEIGLLSGRAPEVKRALNETVLELLRRHLAPLPEQEVLFSVNVHDLDRDSYARHDEPRAGV